MLLGTFFLLSGQLSAQMIWSAYKVPRGSQLESLFQDSQGFLWFGNTGSVQRFDGSSWKTFSFGDTVSATVTCFSECAKGEIWAGLDNGDIYFTQHGKWEKFDPEEGTPKKAISGLLYDKEGRLWISTYGEGLYYYDQERVYLLDETDGLPSEDLYGIALGADEQIWAVTDRGLGIVSLKNGKTITRISREDGLSDEICTSIIAGADQKILVGMYDGNIMHIPKNRSNKPIPIKGSDYPIKEILDDGSFTWILDQDGYLRRQGAQGLLQIETPGLLKHIYLGQQGRIWIIDQKNQLFSAPLYISEMSALPQEPQALSRDSDGNIWLGTSKGLFTYKISRGELLPIPKTSNLNISSLYSDSFNRIWIGTLGQGLWLFEPNNQNLVPISLSGITSKVPILSISGSKEKLWIASFGGAYLCEFSSDGTLIGEKHFKEADGQGINYIYQSVTDSKGNSLLATDGQGLGKWENGTLHLEPQLLGSSIFSISQDASGGIWLLGDKGEVIYQKGNQCDTLLAFNDQQALAIQAISSQRALLVYEKELFCLDLEKRLLIPLLTAGQFSGFGSHLNVLSKGPEGEIWLGSPQTLLKLDTRKIPQEPAPISRIKQVLINLQPQEENQKIFSHDENHFTFDYTAIWYTDPERINYRYHLSGHDLSWIESRDQRVVYADLKPGKYLFQIQAGIDGIFDEEGEKRFAFRIARPFWLRPVFFLPFLLILLSLLYTLIQAREARIKKTQELLRKSVEHQFETLRSQINPHFLFNAFSTLTDLVEEAPNQAIAYISRLSDLFRDVLEHRDSPVISLREELRILDNYYALQKERYGNNFHLSLAIPDQYLGKKVPPLVLQILVENTLRHNVASKKQPLSVEIFTEADQIVIQNPIQLRRSVSHSTKVGLQNIRERYRLLTQEEVEITSEEEVFTVKLPLLS